MQRLKSDLAFEMLNQIEAAIDVREFVNSSMFLRECLVMGEEETSYHVGFWHGSKCFLVTRHPIKDALEATQFAVDFARAAICAAGQAFDATAPTNNGSPAEQSAE